MNYKGAPTCDAAAVIIARENGDSLARLMTKHEAMTMAIAQGLVANNELWEHVTYESLADAAFDQANALLLRLARVTP